MRTATSGGPSGALPMKAVIECRDVAHSVYELPLALQKESMDELVLDLFGLIGR